MRILCILSIVLSTLTAPPARAAGFEASPEDGRIRVLVFKKGLFSGFAHDHRFEVAAWQVTAQVPEGDPAGLSVEVILQAGSLHDHQEGLSDSERAEVDAKTAGPEVLDAAHHPQVTWRSQSAKLEAGKDHQLRGTARGLLTVRGKSRPVDLAIEARRDGGSWRVEGKGRFRQSDFGISPFSGFLGTVGVEDELQIEIALTLRPAPARAESAAPPAAAAAGPAGAGPTPPPSP